MCSAVTNISSVVGVDIGGSKVLAGVVSADGTVLARVRLETPHRSKTPDVVESTIVEAVHGADG